MLLIELDGNSRPQLEEEYEAVGELCLQHGAIEVYVGNTPTTERKMWAPRVNLAEAFKTVCPVQSIEDIVVPTARSPELISLQKRIKLLFDPLNILNTRENLSLKHRPRSYR